MYIEGKYPCLSPIIRIRGEKVKGILSQLGTRRLQEVTPMFRIKLIKAKIIKA